MCWTLVSSHHTMVSSSSITRFALYVSVAQAQIRETFHLHVGLNFDNLCKICVGGMCMWMIHLIPSLQRMS